MRGRLSARLTFAFVCGAALCSFPAHAQSSGRRGLPGHVPAAVARFHLQPVSRLPATNQLNLAIGLPLRNQAELAELLRQLNDPSSSNYHHFLTPEEFTARFGPTEADYAAVRTYARTNGLVVTGAYGNRLLLDVAGSAAAVENAFHITLRTYQHPTESRDFFAPDTEPSVDAALPVVDVQGLSDYSRPHPKLHHAKAAGNTIKAATPNSGSGPVESEGATYIGDDFRNAYVPGSDLVGSGQMVGLLEFDGFYASDITAYENLTGRTNIPLQTVLLDSFSGTPTTGANSGNDEVSLDIEMAMAIAPALASIVVFEGNPNGNQFKPNDVLNSMAASNTVKNLSCSWGWTGGPTTTTDNIFIEMAVQGQSFFNASGDSDAYPPGAADTDAPDSSPYITQAGATTLTMNGTGASYASETVWNWNYDSSAGAYVGTSGGVSSYYSIPSWQQGINSFLNNGGSITMRNIPDVAMVGDNVYIKYGNGGGGLVGGTSCAAPLWAGFMALVNQQAAASGTTDGMGFVNPAIYEIANESIYNSAFNDIMTGNNTWPSSPNAFYAVPGYDLCTGLGTPAGTNLINALVNPDPLIVVSNGGFNAVGVSSGTFNIASQTFYLTNAGASTLTWSVVNTSSWLNVFSGGGELDAGDGTSATASLNTVASNLTAGIYTANLGFSNVTSGVTHYRFFTLTVSDPLLILPTNNFPFAGLPGGPFAPASQGIILTNEGSGAFNWSVNNTSSWFNVSPASGTLSSHAQAVVTITPAPAITNLPVGIYSVVLQVTNLASQFVQPITLNAFINQSLVPNGGFETGDFTDWTLNGDGGTFDYVTTSVSASSGFHTYTINPHSGTYFAALGETNGQAYLSQTLPTSAGQKYLLSLWLDNPLTGSSRNPNEFSVSWNGITLYDKRNIGVINWTNLQFVVTATGNGTVLKIGGRDDNFYLGLDDVSVVPGFAPSISTQPTNLTVLSGSNAVFFTAVSGTAPLTFQWSKNGTLLANGGNVSGATSNVLTFTAAATNNSGNYTLAVSNVFGAVTSGVATLTVVLPAAINTSPVSQTIQCGSNATFNVAATGTPPLNYQWSVDGAAISGATNTTLSLANIHVPNHVISVVVTNLYWSVTNFATLFVQDTLPPVITLNSTNPFYVELGGAYTEPGASAYDLCSGAVPVIAGGTVNTNAIGTNLVIYTASDGSNSATNTRTVIVRDTTPPAILRSFTNLTLTAGTGCSAAMPDVTGTNFILATDLSGALNISQNPANAAILPLGTNTVIITVADASGNRSFSTNQIIVQDETPPVIFLQPQSQTNTIGASVSFSVGAAACTTLTFQWFSNNVALYAETNSTLTLSNVTAGVAGNYFAVVTAAGGSTNSGVATLTVNLISPVLVLASSGNPTGFMDNVNFTASLAPTNVTGTVQFLTNGTPFDIEPLVAGIAVSTNTAPAELPRGTNLITAIYSGDANNSPATNTLAQIVTNHPPIATAAYYDRLAGVSLLIAVSDLATNWSDPDGDAVSLAGIGVSADGVTVTNNSGTLVYFDTNNVNDQFVCTISDGWGGTNFQTVYVEIVLTNTIPSIIGLGNGANGGVTLSLSGAPGHTYVLEATSNLLSPGGWLPLFTNTLGTNGVWSFTDTQATNYPIQFYRLMLAQ